MRNALKAMSESQRRQLVVTTTLRDQATIEISVADSGPGLAPEVRERLFQPFITTKCSGMGLGLSICRRIVEAHGGQLWSEPNPTGGTIFRFYLAAVSKRERAHAGCAPSPRRRRRSSLSSFHASLVGFLWICDLYL